MNHLEGTDSPPARAALRTGWMRLAFVIAPVVVLWGIPEAIVRLADPALEQYREVRFGGDPNSPALFMRDPGLHWKLRPDVRLRFRGVRVRTNSDGGRGHEFESNRRNVLCLGDSTTFGWDVEEPQCYPARLEDLLGPPEGEMAPWQVINAGVPGYSAHQMSLVAPELLRKWQPDVVVLCAGNNDAWPAERSDKELAEARRGAIRFERVMSASRFAVWLREQLDPPKRRPFVAGPLLGASPRVSTADFADNVRKIIRAARRHDARVIIVEPPVNLRRPPLLYPGMPEWGFWSAWCRDVSNLVESGKIDEAMSRADAQLRTKPGNPHALWMKGYAVSAAGRTQEGLELLEQSLESEPLPESCKRSYRDVLADVARKENVDFVSVNEMLRASEAWHGGKSSMYLDHCHPTPAGHRLIACALRQLIRPDGAPR